MSHFVLPRACILLVPALVFAAEQSNCAGTNLNSAPTALTKGAKIDFASTNYDFGKVTVGEVVKKELYFTNSGDEMLVISEVKSECSCLRAGQKTWRVPPGNTGVVPVELYTAGRKGPLTKSLTVVCNASNGSALSLQFTATVWHPLEAEPPWAAFTGALDSDAKFSKLIKIVNNEPEAVFLEGPATSRRSIAAELKTNHVGKEYELTVRLLTPLGTGNVFGEVTMKTSAATMPLLKIPVWAVAQPAVMVLPQQVVLPSGPLTNSLVRTVSVRSNWDKPLALSETSLNVEGVQLEVAELQAGQHFSIELRFPAGFQLPPGGAQLRFRSTHPVFKEIKVPILGLPGPASIPGSP